MTIMKNLLNVPVFNDLLKTGTFHLFLGSLQKIGTPATGTGSNQLT